MEIGFSEPVLSRPPISVARESNGIVPEANWGVSADTYDLDTGEMLLSGGEPIPGDFHLSEAGHWMPKPYLLGNPGSASVVRNDYVRRVETTAIAALQERDAWAEVEKATSVAAVTQLATKLGYGAEPIGRMFTIAMTALGWPHCFYKEYAATTATWDQALSTAEVPKPPREAGVIDLDRILHGTIIYPENTAWELRFAIGGAALSEKDLILTFYFGGEADILSPPAGQDEDRKKGGTFACHFYGDGTAVLYERLLNGWTEVGNFRWCEGQAGTDWKAHKITFLPYSQDRLDIIVPGVEQIRPPHLAGEPRRTLRKARKARAVALSTAEMPVDYLRKRTMTGAGPVRLDLRRDLNPYFSIAHLSFPARSLLTDQAFVLPSTFPADAPVYMSLIDGHVPDVCGLSVVLKRADTGATITYVPDATPPHWELPDGVRRLKAEFTFNSSPSRRQAPTMKGFTAMVPGKIDEIVRVGANVPLYNRVSITGPDLTPDHEMASVEVEDFTNLYPSLRSQGRIPARIWCRWWDPWASVYRQTILMQGEIPKPRGQGGLGATGFLPDWRAYALQLVGQWARLADQLNFSLRKFEKANTLREPTLTADPKTGEWPPWRITDMVKEVLLSAGVPEDMQDIADMEIRFWPAQNKESDLFTLLPTATFVDFLTRLTRDYLGAYLWFDPNAGARGKWRLRLPPKAPKVGDPWTPLWSFTKDAPGGGKVPFRWDAYGVRSTFIARDSYYAYVVPPEADYALVTATGHLRRDGAGDEVKPAWVVNPKSYDFDPANPTADPTHPDYLWGRFVPIVYHDPGLAVHGVSGEGGNLTQALTRLMAYRLGRLALRAQLWVEFTAPLVFVVDPTLGHYRPPSVNDRISVNGAPAVLHSCNPSFEKSELMFADYQALILRADDWE